MILTTTLVVLLLIPIGAYWVNKKLLSGKLRNVSISAISAISAICVYAFILAGVAYIEYKLDAELAAFDLNGDGIFSGNEITPEQGKAMYRVIADTGRTFAPFTGAIFSVIYFLSIWLLLSIIAWVGKWRESRNT